MKVLNALLNILNEHKILYSVAAVILVFSSILCMLIPYNFVFIFLVFCGDCCIIYGLLLHFEKSEKRFVALTSKICRICAILLICIFIISFIAIQSFIIGSMNDDETACDYLIVLGGGLKGREPSHALIYRLDRAIEYMNNYPQSVAILCGGQGKGEIIPEAEAMHNYMSEHGIDKSRLILDDTSKDTRENIQNAFEIITAETKSNSVPPVCVVSNNFHLYRTKIIMEKQGFDIVHTLCAEMPPIPILVISSHVREYFSVMLEYMNL